VSLVHTKVFIAIRDAQKPPRKAEIVNKLGMDGDTVSCALERLKSGGWVRGEGTRNTMVYVVCREGAPTDCRGIARGLQERIYDSLKAGPMSVRDLARLLGASREVVSNTLCVLRRKGITRPLGPASPKVKHYRIEGAPNPKRVRDPGGYAPRRAPKVVEHVRNDPVVPCALAESWGWLPSPKLQRRQQSVLLSGGTVRPQET
jgi:hypothetical protein